MGFFNGLDSHLKHPGDACGGEDGFTSASACSRLSVRFSENAPALFHASHEGKRIYQLDEAACAAGPEA